MRKSELEGKPLIVSESIGNEYGKVIKATIKLLHRDLMQGIDRIYITYAQDNDSSDQKGNGISQLKILFNKLLRKYTPIFSFLAKNATERMINRVLKNSSSTLKLSLRDISQDLAIKTDFMTEKLNSITKAVTIESVSLIKTIPSQYLNEVQSIVMNSITTGKGFHDLKKSLDRYYGKNARKAELVALDQTRKAYRNIQAEKLKKLGVRKFKWLHTGGSNEPRKLHMDLNGKVFSFDNPPYIGEMYGEKVYGLPGQLPNCRCSMKPVIDFEDE
ncbi:SPP1 gp7 family putative phage head morphogenesis protein [Volucribacter psittacicida]|uniref:SPP1 gp7 family putative phage head morphogenesis protein n=1 Tax=Volucribacter psittacicida TaxID=203482 RepID=A0A4V2PB56_9PAST|nr:minor capsid protein [Volucribacter psittacicida]TCJ96155.1 SPP1 gp7 family putative phage head morphogenesis protein [Volucribacter psittacicida]